MFQVVKLQAFFELSAQSLRGTDPFWRMRIFFKLDVSNHQLVFVFFTDSSPWYHKIRIKSWPFLVGGFKYLYFHPYLGKISILTNIFQMGWNHQPDLFGRFFVWLKPPTSHPLATHRMSPDWACHLAMVARAESFAGWGPAQSRGFNAFVNQKSQWFYKEFVRVHKRHHISILNVVRFFGGNICFKEKVWWIRTDVPEFRMNG